MIKISYCIGTKNEGSKYLDPLFSSLLNTVDSTDEIIVVDDNSDEQTTLDTFEKFKNNIKVFKHSLDGDFAAHKNYKKSMCSGDYIFDIDGDELVSPVLLRVLKETLLLQPHVDLFYVPRINVVQGITEDHMRKYGWQYYPGTAWINYPDYQGRIFKNSPNLYWTGKVHERIVKNDQELIFTHFPFKQSDSDKPLDHYCILHRKDIERQEKQNDFYSKIS